MRCFNYIEAQALSSALKQVPKEIYLMKFMFISGLPSIDPSNSSTTSSSGPLTGFSANMQGARVYLQGPAPVGTPSFNRQHFSPHPWTSATNSCRNLMGLS